MSRRGTSTKPHNRFETNLYEKIDDWILPEEAEQKVKTMLIPTHPKSIVNPVSSPDISMDWSMNPYAGCEHGCPYCYARNSHEYWGYNSGEDFESKILYKANAAELLRKKLNTPSWKGDAIMLSGNTDCYQPIERKLELTRQLLEVAWEYRQPIGIITKNALILRDLDILKKMAEHDLVRVAFSVTTEDASLQRKLEPRASAPYKRLAAIKKLSEEGIPTMAMIAPMIPGLNSHELLPLMKAVSEAGALQARYITVRLNGHLRDIFSEWLMEHYPDRHSKVMNTIRDTHGGKVNAFRYGIRMSGTGRVSETMRQAYAVGQTKYFKHKKMPALSSEHFTKLKDRQMGLFD
ncbi:PA0069 family radical SAM protein [Phaeocystidibacter luteus]|uniref:PA0069 family radical SAM protein n=1 Tax=Phaeocystidibacter luteus TaxID=911197 RepID=A0A6N6RLI7_9FLAO|nr:PA0069 family radical SAM protein [Phaeocystidibacter luteus]KAB2814436.1 PA0069 family radical SAM protein [Phaeocystidibacter luteus]